MNKDGKILLSEICNLSTKDLKCTSSKQETEPYIFNKFLNKMKFNIHNLKYCHNWKHNALKGKECEIDFVITYENYSKKQNSKGKIIFVEAKNYISKNDPDSINDIKKENLNKLSQYKEFISLLYNYDVYSAFCFLTSNKKMKYIFHKYNWKCNDFKETKIILPPSHNLFYQDDDQENSLNVIINYPAKLNDYFKAYKNGKYNKYFFTENNKYFDSIINALKEKDLVLIKGDAGSGKTILAFRLLKKYSGKKTPFLLLLNFGFVKILDFVFKKNKIFSGYNHYFWYSSENLSSPGNKYTHVIIDEAQRSFTDIVPLIKDKKAIVFFDNHQKISWRDKFNVEELQKAVPNNLMLELGSTIRIKTKNINLLMCYIDFSRQHSTKKLDNFYIEIKDNFADFFSSFKAEQSNVKCMATFQYVTVTKEMKDNNVTLTKPHEYFNHTAFTSDEFRNKIIYAPYNVISQEVEVIYIYFPDTIEIINNKLQSTNKEFLNYQDLFLNQLYVLMTRATKKICFCIENDKIREKFQEINEKMK